MGSKIIKSKINLFFFLQVNRVPIPEIVIGGYFLVIDSSGNRGGLVPVSYTHLALLLKYDIQTQTHNGVKTMLGLHFVATGKLPLKIGKTFSTLFEKRHSGDYDDFAYCDEDLVNELFPQAKIFIDAITDLIKTE